jgi:hypothetical protein
LASPFLVHDLRRQVADSQRDDLSLYLFRVHDRLHNAMNAETRVYTCRSWRRTGGATEPFDLHWNADTVPGETMLGTCGTDQTDAALVERIEAEFANGDAVRLFIFNSDADLCFEESLIPQPRSDWSP